MSNKWTDVKFGGTAIEKVVGGGFGENGRYISFGRASDENLTAGPAAGPDIYVLLKHATATFTVNDYSAQLAAIQLGTQDTLTGTLHYAKSAGGVKYTMVNATVEEAAVLSVAFDSAKTTGFWRGHALDGQTNPLSLAYVPPPPTPDAILMPDTCRNPGGKLIDFIASIAAIADPILKVDPSKQERSYIRQQHDGKMFATKSPVDTLYFPFGHSQQGKSRYRWESQADGMQYGYLVEGAWRGKLQDS